MSKALKIQIHEFCARPPIVALVSIDHLRESDETSMKASGEANEPKVQQSQSSPKAANLHHLAQLPCGSLLDLRALFFPENFQGPACGWEEQKT